MRLLYPEHWKAALPCKGVLMRWKVIVLICLVLCCCAISCDLFKTRTPEEPVLVSSNDVPATDASLVFQNMIYAFQESNAVNYSKTISGSSFTFTASGNAIQRYVQLSDWNKSKEQQYFTNVINRLVKNSKVSLEFTTIASQNYPPDSCELVKNYLLNVPSTVSSPANVYKGQAKFTLIRDPLNGYWYIRRWVDYELSPSDLTWSDLKGSFAN